MTFEKEIRQGRCEELRCQAQAVAFGLKAMRKAYRVSRSTMACYIGINETTLRRVENGWQAMSYANLRFFAERLGKLSVTQLVKNAERYMPPEKDNGEWLKDYPIGGRITGVGNE